MVDKCVKTLYSRIGINCALKSVATLNTLCVILNPQKKTGEQTGKIIRGKNHICA